MKSAAKKEEPRWITEESLFVIHAQQVERYGGSHGVLDKALVLAALRRPIDRWAHEEAVASVDFADLAAFYLVAFAGTQGFNDGNKRTGLACALVFLGLNSVSFEADAKELYELTLRVATHQIGGNDAAIWFRQRIK
ncbi:MAG TPA: type II toxin-antitoxin system death-on-curing family toxin [Gemmatimonadaceae bacterium]|nr:type II toxin-antitoxin system death-on-curing family toxin [Gemmatimonadaceae bacterium]